MTLAHQDIRWAGLNDDFYVVSTLFQSYRDLEAGDNQSMKSYWRDRGSNPEPLAPQAGHSSRIAKNVDAPESKTSDNLYAYQELSNMFEN